MAPVTQTITVLFTDLVGSTELFSSLSPQEADDLRNDHFSLLRGAVSGAGGLKVKSLGDGLMVAFSSLSRALACAVAMQQAVERRNRRSPNALAIRVGLSTGGRAAKLEPVEAESFGDLVLHEAIERLPRHPAHDFAHQPAVSEGVIMT